MKSLASFILRGPAQAILVAVLTGVLALILPPLSLISGAVVALITLRKGPQAGAVVMLASTAFVAAMAWVSLGNGLVGLVFLGVIWLPLWVLGWVLRETRSLGFTTMVAGLLGVLGILIAYWWIGDISSWWEGVLKTIFKPVMETGGPLEPEALKRAIVNLSRIMTGVAASGLVLNTLLCLYLARGWQAQLFNPGGFRSEFHALRLGYAAAITGVVLVGLSALPLAGLSHLAAEMMIVVLSLFILQGLAVVHAIVAIKKMHIAWLIGLYVVVMFILPQLMVAIALLGLMDTWLDFRRRVERKSKIDSGLSGKDQ
jgi:hypothetical protein